MIIIAGEQYSARGRGNESLIFSLFLSEPLLRTLGHCLHIIRDSRNRVAPDHGQDEAEGSTTEDAEGEDTDGGHCRLDHD